MEPETETHGKTELIEKDAVLDLEMNTIRNNNNNSDNNIDTNNIDNKIDDDDKNVDGNFLSIKIEKMEKTIHEFFTKHGHKIKKAIYTVLLLGYFVYFAYCMQHRFGDEGSITLLGITIVLVWKLVSGYLDRRGMLSIPKYITSFIGSPMGQRLRRIIKRLLYVVATVLVAVYLGVDVFPQNTKNLQSFVGMFALMLMCFIMSSKPTKVNWHAVFWSLMMQFGFAFWTLRTESGYNVFKWLGDQVQGLMAYSETGSEFVIGKNFREMGFAFSASGVIIFTNAFIFLMNQLGVIEVVVLKLGMFLQFCLGTGAVESVAAAANIFIGMAEAPLLFRPYLPTITKSELHTIMTCGFASIAGGVMGLFIALGAPANHLLTAAVISAPAALAISKLMYPETERVAEENQKNIKIVDKKQTNSLNSFSEGDVMGLTICAAVWANMLAFFAMLDLLNSVCVWFGQRAGVDGFTFDAICSYVLYPIAFLMGVAPNDCKRVGSLIGVKLFATPIVGYTEVGYLIENRNVFEDYLSYPGNDTSWHWKGDDIFLERTNVTLVNGIIAERSEVIATYAMCGFSAFTSIGICLGAMVPLCPSRKEDIVELVVRAFIAGNMASFATGAIAGTLFSGDVS